MMMSAMVLQDLSVTSIHLSAPGMLRNQLLAIVISRSSHGSVSLRSVQQSMGCSVLVS